MPFRFLILLFLNPLLIEAQTFDFGFAETGFFRINIDWFDEPVAVAAFPEGSLVLLANAGHQDSLWYDQDIALVKFTASGTLDSTFGNNGQLVFDSGNGYYSQARDLLTDSLGIIYVLSSNEAESTNKSVFIQSFNSDGTINSGFGEEGKYECRFLSLQNDASSFAMFNNRIVVAATAFDTTAVHRELPAILALRTDGTPDSSFGGTGKMVFDIGNGIIYPFPEQHSNTARHNSGGFFSDLVLSNQGIVAGGAFSSGLDYRCMLASVNWNGQTDSSFYYQGVLVFEQPGMPSSWISQLVETEDHQLMAAIRNTNTAGSPSACLAILNAPENELPQFKEPISNYVSRINDLELLHNQEVVFSSAIMNPENYQGFVNSEFAGIFKLENTEALADILYLDQVDDGFLCESGPLYNYSNMSLYNAISNRVNEDDLSTDVCIIRLNLEPSGISEIKNTADANCIYPVPADDHFFVNGLVGDQVLVFDYLGRQITSVYRTGASSIKIDCSKWKSGSYHVVIKNDEGIRYSRILLKN